MRCCVSFQSVWVLRYGGFEEKNVACFEEKRLFVIFLEEVIGFFFSFGFCSCWPDSRAFVEGFGI